MGNKQILSYIIASIYTLAVILGIIHFLTVTLGIKALVMAVIGIITLILIFFIRDRNLKSAFFMSAVALINFAMGYYWESMNPLLMIFSFLSFMGEILFLLLSAYNKLQSKSKSSYSIGAPASTELNVLQFCKSKHAEQDKVDQCVANIMSGGGGSL